MDAWTRHRPELQYITMTATHPPHHHHAPPPRFSLLRASAAARLGLAAAGIAALWLAVALALGWV